MQEENKKRAMRLGDARPYKKGEHHGEKNCSTPQSHDSTCCM
jgi:hypothetical protein